MKEARILCRSVKVYEAKLVYQLLSNGPAPLLDNPPAVVAYLAKAFDEFPQQEQVFVIPVNGRNRPFGRLRITLGTATASLLHPREVFRPVIVAWAAVVILAHNHPSGDPSPSRADLEVTRTMAEVARLLDIVLLDHIIVGHPDDDPHGLGFYSFTEAGLI